MKRFIAAGVLATALAFFQLGGVGLAFPGNGKGQEIIPLTCGDEALTVVVPNGQWGAAHVVETGQIGIPVSFDIVVTDPDGQIVFEEHVAKPGHANQETQVCTFIFEEDGFTIDGTVVVMIRPKG